MSVTQKLGTAELLFLCSQQMGLMPTWVTPGETFAISVNGRERYVNLARSPLNSDASAALAKNKYVTRRILERHNLQNIPFALPRSHADAADFLSKHRTIIAKPITGAGARDIHIITEPSELEPLDIRRYILEKYIIGQELRYLLLNGQVIGVHRSDYGTSVAQDRPLQRISYPQSLWDQALVSSSLHIADILGLKFAAVDFLVNESGQAYILEINTMPGLKWFHAPSSGPVVDVARLFMNSVVGNTR
ncbi:MAG TPA: ATP-grasp domain-containing protein [Candidatus Saccharimonadales bacterium]|nr:ATP-grasp domain-containing protein [Candidatus Saccharimonadales bacterium]